MIHCYLLLEQFIIVHLKNGKYYTHRMLNIVPKLEEILALPQVIYT